MRLKAATKHRIFSQLNSSSEVDEDIALSIKSDAVFSAAKFDISSLVKLFESVPLSQPLSKPID